MRDFKRRKRRSSPFSRDWSARKIAKVATLALLGYSSSQIAAVLKDGTLAGSIRRQLGLWGIYDMTTGDGRRRVAIRLHHKALSEARKQAAAAGLPLEVWAGRIVEFAARDKMYDSIVDGGDDAYAG